ncbi:MAG: hypothetical protein B6D73_15295 [gamma proteobacterium symbiont of Stewartia floridana]|nr:MAG: hypothetical protein B6D73_15295 [gamma proteobacterium symbiont of Stewartia floridana]
MSKSDLTWIIIRFTGLFLAIKALVTLPEVISSFWFLYTVGPDIENELPGVQFSLKVTLKEATKGIMHLLLYGFGAFYLIFRGSAVFKLVRIPNSY